MSGWLERIPVYSPLYRTVREVVEGQSFHLLERLVIARDQQVTWTLTDLF